MTETRSKTLFPVLICGSVFLCGLVAVSIGPSLRGSRLTSVLLVLALESFWVSGWILAALGWGVPLRRVLLKNSDEILVQLALGTGALMLLDWLLGVFGMLTSLSAWGLTISGIIVAAADLKLSERIPNLSSISVSRFWILLMPALSLVCGAATVAPGALWFSEFSGWDALAYHLQLSHEWHSQGRIVCLDYNVYSCLPNSVEAAFLHLACFRGGMQSATFSAQLLQSAFAAATALALGRAVMLLARRTLYAGNERSRDAGIVAAVVYLALPWTVVTGSLAFDEQAMMFFGSAALLLLFTAEALEYKPVLAIGMLCGFSALAKVSAAFVVVVPIAIVLFMLSERQLISRLILLSFFGVGLLAVCAPWLLRNAIVLGNPFFPGGTEVFGMAHWNSEQAQRFGNLYRQRFGLPATLKTLWQAFFESPLFGHLLLPFAIVSTLVLALKPAARRPALALAGMAVLQTVFWALCTHHPERFLIPVAIPLTVLSGFMAAAGRFQFVSGLLLAAALTFTSYRMYFSEPGTPTIAIDGVEFMMLEAQPYKTLNALPPGSRVYAEGFATPFYVNAPLTYHTVWDKSKLGAALSRGGPAEARAWLRASGYTHLIVDWGMIETWQSPGNYGYDSTITIPKLREFAAALPVLHDGLNSRCSIYVLK